MTPSFRLESTWDASVAPNGRFDFALVNLGPETLEGFQIAYTALTRVIDRAACRNARFVARDANYHAYAPPEGLRLAPGETWRFSVGGLHRPARHRTDGPKSAYLTDAEGRHHAVAVADCMLAGAPSELPPAGLPQGRLDEPFALLPWPRHAALKAGDAVPVALHPEKGSAAEDVLALDAALALFQRLFPVDHVPFRLEPAPGTLALRFRTDGALGAEACEIEFGETITVRSGGPAGRQHALVSLAQMLRAARADRERFRFPASGRIEDEPRYGWRGCHLDVSRQFYPVADVLRLIDIMAWAKLDVLHWHLTDDEAWRLEIRAYPELTTTGVLRGPDEPLKPQLGNGAEPVGGFYSQDDVRRVVAHAAALHVEVVPEIDIPGHNAATLVALPDLTDGQEAPDSYHSVQGYPNNALNPGIEATYPFLETVLDEMAELFPSPYVHVGGDEVADGAWLASPKAKEVMAREGFTGTFELQSWFLARVQRMLEARGKRLAGWNEVAHGGGVDPAGTLLMAWEKPEVGIELAREGYDVVMTPGQAYYLDMVQDDAWQEPGASWAGTVPPAHTYGYEAEGDLPEELRDRLKGIQACIWSEHFLNRDYFNHLVFPRLYAIAESAWTPRERKSWDRFCALAPLGPKL
ncbi:beta-N-acetylhexosaminidase [Aureimonas sp. AU4]|uniref:beta-N-acetylhexosaminidase n=1 Tax=Aureimonas sp. AU4 TaxID=1638163 RepID=UPI000780BABA|nr:family 20 glycosylhydrolase [Aureimonas sp. AU4]